MICISDEVGFIRLALQEPGEVIKPRPSRIDDLEELNVIDIKVISGRTIFFIKC